MMLKKIYYIKLCYQNYIVLNDVFESIVGFYFFYLQHNCKCNITKLKGSIDAKRSIIALNDVL